MAMTDKAAMHNQYPNQSASQPRAGQSISRRLHMGPFRIALFAVLALVSAVSLNGQTGTVMPIPRVQWLDNNGLPCNGCLLDTFAAGTLTPLATYSDSALATPNANPVVADASGRMVVYLSATTYKFRLRTSAGVTLWTQDNIASTALGGSGVGTALVSLGGDPDVPVTATSFPSGTTFDKAHAGTLIFNFNSGNLVGTYALEGMLLGNGGTVTAGLVNLSDGSPDTALVTIASASTTGARQISSAITFATPGAAKDYAVKVKVTAGSGRAWALRLVKLS